MFQRNKEKNMGKLIHIAQNLQINSVLRNLRIIEAKQESEINYKI
jgi:hypothetical protein